MTKQAVETHSGEKEKVFLVIVDIYKNNGDGWTLEETRREMEELVIACGGEVVGTVICHLDKFSASTLIGDGRVKEIADFCGLHPVDTVIFSYDLKGSHQRNLEEVIKAKIIDRTQLILDIFAKHATSKEGKMQVELAQLEYLLPRLVGKGTELSRLGGGIGTLGPGETKLEIDRRRIGQRITRLKKDLNGVAADRQLKRKKRKDQGVPLLSIVGYTNAGKSTLLNTLTQAGQTTRDGLFTTLDSLSRQLVLPNHQKVVISDTVGFMHDLPHRLIEAFHATLEEVKEADILLHVIDVSYSQFRHRQESVMQVLQDLEAGEKLRLVVFNKVDRIADRHWVDNLLNNYEHAVAISAKTGENIDKLIEAIGAMIRSLIKELNIDIPINRMDLVNLAHEQGQVLSIKYYAETINLRVAVPAHVAGFLEKAQVSKKGQDS